MAKETIQAVRNAELSATKLEKEAIQKKEAILLEAQQNAKKLAATLIDVAQDKAIRDVEEAVRQGVELTESAKQNVEKEICFMREMVKSKEQAAIDLVISNVV